MIIKEFDNEDKGDLLQKLKLLTERSNVAECKKSGKKTRFSTADIVSQMLVQMELRLMEEESLAIKQVDFSEIDLNQLEKKTDAELINIHKAIVIKVSASNELNLIACREQGRYFFM